MITNTRDRGRFVGGDQICHQSLILAVLSQERDRIHYARAVPQRAFNFSQLDAKATELDLMVHASEKIQRTVGAVSDQVTSAIERARLDSTRPIQKMIST